MTGQRGPRLLGDRSGRDGGLAAVACYRTARLVHHDPPAAARSRDARFCSVIQN